MAHPSEEQACRRMIEYRMEIVGGPFDGTAGMRWRDDGDHPPPELILLGVCPGDGSCNSGARRMCAQKRKRHPYFWLPDEGSMPTKVVVYELSESFVEPHADEPMALYPGRAIYVIGGLLLPRDDSARELIGAGVGGAATYNDELPDGGVYARRRNCPCVLLPIADLPEMS